MKIAVIAAAATWLYNGDTLMAASLLTFGVIWTILKTTEGPPVLALAMTFQCLSVTIGLFYIALTGREVLPTIADYRPMVALGLGCILAITVGLYAGRRLIDRLPPITEPRPEHAFSFYTMMMCYAGSVAAFGTLITISVLYPTIRQIIVALAYLKLAILYLVFRRLVHMRQWWLLIALLCLEIVLGITGFYAGFREPIIIAALAVLEVFDRRRVRHWVTLAGLAAAACILGVVWVNVRVTYRQQFVTDERFAGSRSARIDSLGALINTFSTRDTSQLAKDVDHFIERLWVVYYPALAVARVPTTLPHTNGDLMWATLVHVATPRIFFPDKPDLASDSEMVRKYSGIWVAGEKEDTSIAFGYAAESYIDFGVPGMFVPPLVWGLFVGVCYAGLLRWVKHREMAISVVTMISWMSLYLFERSWAKTIGFSGTLLIYVGAVTFLFDRLWYEKFRATLPSAATPGLGPELAGAVSTAPLYPRLK